MALNFDNFPVYDPLIKSGTNLISDSWSSFMSSFIQTLTGYLSQYGMFVPRVTTDQRDSLIDVTDGQMIYNTTLKKFQGHENGSWVNFI